MKCLFTSFFFFLTTLVMYGQQFKVMTYNIRLDVASDAENAWPLRKDYFASQIQFYEPDILGIQEALPHQVAYFESVLPLYSQVGIGRDGEGKGESSNIFFKKDRYKLLDNHTFWLSETPDKISKGWDAALNRVCTYALLSDKESGRRFWVFNTHLDHVGETARTKSLELILAKIEALNRPNYPVIFMGDFNSEPDSERIQSLSKVMFDTRAVSKNPPFGPVGTFNGFKHHEPVTRRIDYIFISQYESFVVHKYAVLSDSKNAKYPSDHLPVFVELSFIPL
jgi:endonuclease/exonuclease/phosphatase family metal-dependent hydrolase